MPRVVRRPVVPGPADGEAPVRIPDDAGDRTRALAGSSTTCMCAAGPRAPAVDPGEIGRQRHRGGPVRGGEVSLGERTQGGRVELQDLHARRHAASRSIHPGPCGTRLHDPDVVVPAVEAHLEVLVGQLLHQALSPLDDGHRVGGGRVEVEVVDVGHAAEPVGVDVHQRHPAAAVHAGDDERRRGDRLPDAEAGADPLGQRGLAGTERPTRTTRSPGRQQLGQGDAEPVRVGRRRQHVLAPHVRRPRDGGRGRREPGARGAVRAEPDRGRGVVRGPDRPAVDRVRPAARLRQDGARPEEPLRRREPERDDDRRVEQLQLAPQPPAAPGHLGRLRRPVARRAALHHVEDGGLRARPARPRRAAGRAARPTCPRTAARSRPRWPPAPRRPARTEGGHRPAHHRRRRAGGSRPARGRRRRAGPRRRGSPSPVPRRRCGRPPRPARPAGADGSGHASTLTAGSAGPSAGPAGGTVSPHVRSLREGPAMTAPELDVYDIAFLAGGPEPGGRDGDRRAGARRPAPRALPRPARHGGPVPPAPGRGRRPRRRRTDRAPLGRHDLLAAGRGRPAARHRPAPAQGRAARPAQRRRIGPAPRPARARAHPGRSPGPARTRRPPRRSATPRRSAWRSAAGRDDRPEARGRPSSRGPVTTLGPDGPRHSRHDIDHSDPRLAAFRARATGTVGGPDRPGGHVLRQHRRNLGMPDTRRADGHDHS